MVSCSQAKHGLECTQFAVDRRIRGLLRQSPINVLPQDIMGDVSCWQVGEYRFEVQPSALQRVKALASVDFVLAHQMIISVFQIKLKVGGKKHRRECQKAEE